MNFRIGPPCGELYGLKTPPDRPVNGLGEKTPIAGKDTRVTMRAWIL